MTSKEKKKKFKARKKSIPEPIIEELEDPPTPEVKERTQKEEAIMNCQDDFGKYQI